MIADRRDLPDVARPAPGTLLPITIFVHVYYPAVWGEMVARLEEMVAQPFTLVLTTPLQETQLRPPQTPWLRGFTILTLDNRGRDTLPFLTALAQAEPFDVGLKLHTKRSLHRLGGEAWREALLDALLPGPAQVEAITGRLAGDQRFGLAGPDGALCTVSAWIGRNQKPMERLCARLDLDYAEVMAKEPRFVAGSMFWFRRDAMAPLAEANLADLFEAENRQSDGTTAHALERLFGIACAERGQLVTSVGVVLAAPPGLATEELVSLTGAASDVPNVHLTHLPRVLAALDRRFPGLASIYAHLPVPIRRWVRARLRREVP